MNLLENKLARYDEPQKAKAAGIYPYFRAISSEQDTEVIMNGKKVLMFGSNCYSGLVNDERIKQAAIEATEKYGTGCAGSPFLNGTLDLHKQLERKLAEYEGNWYFIVENHKYAKSAHRYINDTVAADAELTVQKTAEPTKEVKVGDTVKYTVTVTNTGNVTVKAIALTDNLVTLNEAAFELAPGASKTVTYNYTVLQADVDAGKIDNTATALGKDPSDKDVKEATMLQ